MWQSKIPQYPTHHYLSYNIPNHHRHQSLRKFLTYSTPRNPSYFRRKPAPPPCATMPTPVAPQSRLEKRKVGPSYRVMRLFLNFPRVRDARPRAAGLHLVYYALAGEGGSRQPRGVLSRLGVAWKRRPSRAANRAEQRFRFTLDARDALELACSVPREVISSPPDRCTAASFRIQYTSVVKSPAAAFRFGWVAPWAPRVTVGGSVLRGFA